MNEDLVAQAWREAGFIEETPQQIVFDWVEDTPVITDLGVGNTFKTELPIIGDSQNYAVTDDIGQETPVMVKVQDHGGDDSTNLEIINKITRTMGTVNKNRRPVAPFVKNTNSPSQISRVQAPPARKMEWMTHAFPWKVTDHIQNDILFEITPLEEGLPSVKVEYPNINKDLSEAMEQPFVITPLEEISCQQTSLTVEPKTIKNGPLFSMISQAKEKTMDQPLMINPLEQITCQNTGDIKNSKNAPLHTMISHENDTTIEQPFVITPLEEISCQQTSVKQDIKNAKNGPIHSLINQDYDTCEQMINPVVKYLSEPVKSYNKPLVGTPTYVYPNKPFQNLFKTKEPGQLAFAFYISDCWDSVLSSGYNYPTSKEGLDSWLLQARQWWAELPVINRRSYWAREINYVKAISTRKRKSTSPEKEFEPAAKVIRAPRRKTPYYFFTLKYKETVAKELGTLSNTNVTRNELRRRWNNLSLQGKKEFVDMASKESLTDGCVSTDIIGDDSKEKKIDKLIETEGTNDNIDNFKEVKSENVMEIEDSKDNFDDIKECKVGEPIETEDTKNNIEVVNISLGEVTEFALKTNIIPEEVNEKDNLKFPKYLHESNMNPLEGEMLQLAALAATETLLKDSFKKEDSGLLGA